MFTIIKARLHKNNYSKYLSTVKSAIFADLILVSFHRQQFLFMHAFLDHIRQRLAFTDAVLLLALLGIIAGALSGGMIVLFRLCVEYATLHLLDGDAENFESLHREWRLLIPIIGSLLLTLLMFKLPKHLRRTGINCVIERFNLHQGVISPKSMIVQFVGGAISLISGHSLGRESAAVHLGAATSSLLGQRAKLPNNSLRVLVGCGVAAGISASFNTPLAGVIFAMEVVMLEYSVTTFTPIILASVMGTILTRSVYGHEAAFNVPSSISLNTLLEIPFLIITGLLLGTLAALFTFMTTNMQRFSRQYHLGARFMVAGVITGAAGWFVPEVLGIGYDTVNDAIFGKVAIASLLIICVFKIGVSSACIASGLPGGVIGPCMVIGATAGAATSFMVNHFLPGSDPGLYSMIGMAAMMAATLQAPLAALIALLELTANPNIIFPGMLVVVIASLVTSQLFKQRGIFQAMLSAQGIKLKLTALSRHLSRTAVPAVMERNIKRVKAELSLEDAQAYIQENPRWFVIEHDTEKTFTLLPAADLANFIHSCKEKEKPIETIDLFQIPAKRLDSSPVLMSATLQEALDMMIKNDTSAVYVHRMNAPGIYRIFGVVTRQDIEHFYTS